MGMSRPAVARIRIPRFADVLPAIERLPTRTPLLKSDLVTDAFRLFRQGAVDVIYMPTPLAAGSAKVMLVGVTPGFTQLELAYRTIRDGLAEGLTPDEARLRAKSRASFGGPMRKLLVQMLDGIGLPAALRIPSSDELFGSESHQLASTSMLKHAVFVNGKNYTGHSAAVRNSPVYGQFLHELLAAELNAEPEALVIPLGDAATEAIHLLAREGLVSVDRCVLGFPHPSGANGHRKVQYAERRASMQAKVAAWFGEP
jgi:hypothetical protein